MNFSLDDEQRQLAASVHGLLSATDVPSVARAWADDDCGPGLDLLKRLSALGLGELVEHPVELVVAFEELGRHAVPGPVVEAFVVAPALLGAPPSPATVAWHPHVPYALDADVATPFVVIRDLVHEATLGVRRESVDPTRRLFELVPGESVGPADGFDRGVLAQAAQLLGLGRGLLERSAEYVRARTQFGRPVGEFQAVKHHLANVLVALEFARPLVHAAAVTGTTLDISAARVAAADAAYQAARAALQVHGAIGYTREYELSWWLLKVRALRSAWGSQTWHRRRVRDGITSLPSR